MATTTRQPKSSDSALLQDLGLEFAAQRSAIPALGDEWAALQTATPSS